jgi:hypothetical protein
MRKQTIQVVVAVVAIEVGLYLIRENKKLRTRLATKNDENLWTPTPFHPGS